MNFLHTIYDFNKQAGLLEYGFNPQKESAYIIEEQLEGFPGYQNIGKSLGLAPESYDTPKTFSRWFTKNLGEFTGDNVDALDRILDTLVFSIGSLYKLGLEPEDVEQCMSIVMDANMSKISQPKDSEGKLTKPKNFIPPEQRLQEYLQSTGNDLFRNS